ncbi:unnamed protein product, partial [Phaeothamnion confervicola]
MNEIPEYAQGQPPFSDDDDDDEMPSAHKRARHGNAGGGASGEQGLMPNVNHPEGMTPLADAAKAGNEVRVAELLRGGASVTSGSAGLLPLNWVASSRRADLAVSLLSALIQQVGRPAAEEHLLGGMYKQKELQRLARCLGRQIYGGGRRYTNKELVTSVMDCVIDGTAPLPPPGPIGPQSPTADPA